MGGGHDAGFDAIALFTCLDRQRADRDLTWTGVARQIWDLSAELNAQRNDHPISATTLTGIPRRQDTSCQHALFMLRWLDRAPEDFVYGTPSASAPLPPAGPDRRLRWQLHVSPRRPQDGLYEAMNDRRSRDGLTWTQLAGQLRCSTNQLQGLRTARFAIGMSIAMQITQWLEVPAATFVYPARW